jgi:hypothetical protein
MGALAICGGIDLATQARQLIFAARHQRQRVASARQLVGHRRADPAGCAND